MSTNSAYMEKPMNPFVNIRPEKGKLQVSWGFNTFAKKGGGKYYCYIPSFDIYFNADSEDKVKIKGRALMRMYMNHFLETKDGLKGLAIQLKKLGFIAPHADLVIKQIINKSLINTAKFKSTDILPDDFRDAEAVNIEQEEIVC